MKLFIGTSGYSYKHWYGVFYPEDLPRNKMLEFYARRFSTVELNVTFYRIPKDTTFKGWYKRTPDNFTFSIKANRKLTHLKRLNCTEEEVNSFLQIISHLQDKASVILWQLPPSFKKNIEKLKSILKILGKFKNYKYAFEFRNMSWFDEETFELLKSFNATLCLADWPINTQTDYDFDFFYLRRHGAFEDAPFSRPYSEREIERDAELVCEKLKKEKDVYVFFNNDTEGFAVKNALELKEKVEKLCPELV